MGMNLPIAHSPVAPQDHPARRSDLELLRREIARQLPEARAALEVARKTGGIPELVARQRVDLLEATASMPLPQGGHEAVEGYLKTVQMVASMYTQSVFAISPPTQAHPGFAPLVQQLEELIASDAPALQHPHVRLELLAQRFALAPTAAHRAALMETLSRVCSENVYGGYTGPYDAARAALSTVIALFPGRVGVSDLIELARPNGSDATLKSLFDHVREGLYRAQARKNIEVAIATGEGKAAADALFRERSELSTNNPLQDVDVRELQERILSLFVESGDIAGARDFVKQQGFLGDRVQAHAALFGRSRDEADLQAACNVVVSDSHYAQAAKWQKIYAVSGKAEHLTKVRDERALLVSDPRYRPSELFSLYARMHGQPGIDSTKLDELRSKAAALPQPDRAGAWLAIWKMSKTDSDAETFLREVSSLRGQEAGLADAPSVLLADPPEKLNANTAYGFLLRDFLRVLDDEPSRASAPRIQETANLLFDNYRRTFPTGDGRTYLNNVFHADVSGAQARLDSHYLPEATLRAQLFASSRDEIVARLDVRMRQYGRPSRATAEQSAIESMIHALRDVRRDGRRTFEDDLEWFANGFYKTHLTVQELRFLDRMIALGEPHRERFRIADDLDARLAEASALTEEAETRIGRIQNLRLRAATLAKVASIRATQAASSSAAT